jgi:hypothetical protein
VARLQILQLPEGAGDDRPPFVLVIDQHQPQRYALGIGEDEPEMVDEFAGVAEQIGARVVLVFQETVEIPANETAVHAQPLMRVADFAGLDEIKRLTEERDEARLWARHGYEIGQRHCGWSDHGVAPDWLTEGWPPHFDDCEHFKRAADYDEALTRVRNLPEEPKFMDALHSDSAGYRHGYRVAIGDAKRATRARAAEDGG